MAASTQPGFQLARKGFLRRADWPMWGLVCLLLVYVVGSAAVQSRHEIWLNGTENDVLGALWPLAQSFDSPQGYGYTGDNPYIELAQGDRGMTAFYPPGYPLLLRALTHIIPSPERASQLINGLAGLLLLLAAFALAAAWTRDRRLAFLTTLVLAVGPVFLTVSYLSGSDLLAAAGMVAALAASLQALNRPERRRWLLLAGLALGAAYLIRRQVFVLTIPLVLAAVWPERRAWRGAAGRVVWFLAPFVLLALPDWGVQAALQGNPFYNANGKNIWNAAINNYDFANYRAVPDTISPLEVIRSAPLAVLRNWLNNLRTYAEYLWLGWPLTLLTVPGAVLLWRRPALRPAAVVALGSVGFLAVVSAIAEQEDRYLVVLLPVLAVLAAAAPWYGLRGRLRVGVMTGLVILGLIFGALTASRRIRVDYAVPHLADVQAALQADGARPSDVLTAFGPGHYAYYGDVTWRQLPGTVYTWEELRAFMMRENATYFVVIGKPWHDIRLHQAEEPAAAPSWLRPLWVAPLGEDARIILYRRLA